MNSQKHNGLDIQAEKKSDVKQVLLAIWTQILWIWNVYTEDSKENLAVKS